MNPNGALVPTVAAVSRAPASVRWNQQQQQLVRWQRTLLLLLRRCRRSPDTRRRSGGGGRKGSTAWGDMVSTKQASFLHLSVHIFLLLYISTVVVANLSANPWPRQCSVLGWSMYCPSEGISKIFSRHLKTSKWSLKRLTVQLCSELGTLAGPGSPP